LLGNAAFILDVWGLVKTAIYLLLTLLNC